MSLTSQTICARVWLSKQLPDFENQTISCSFSFAFISLNIYLMASASSYTTQDISTLRAAALLTLKSRLKPRRLARHPSLENPDDTSSIASTRRAAPSPELDYGSDDTPPTDTAVQVDQEKKAGEKEEGEISDDETQQVTKSSFSMMDIDNEPLPGLNSIVENSSKTNASSDSGGAGPSNLAQSRTSVSKPPPSKQSPISDFRSPYIQSSASVDTKHARPSLESKSTCKERECNLS